MVLWQDSLDRSIPTCVGNAVSAALEELGLPVHPHVRGERTLTESARSS